MEQVGKNIINLSHRFLGYLYLINLHFNIFTQTISFTVEDNVHAGLFINLKCAQFIFNMNHLSNLVSSLNVGYHDKSDVLYCVFNQFQMGVHVLLLPGLVPPLDARPA